MTLEGLVKKKKKKKKQKRRKEKSLSALFCFLSLTVGVCCVSVCWMYAACVLRVREWNIV